MGGYYDLPLSVCIDDVDYAIRDRCDYRAILDTIDVFEDKELTDENMVKLAIYNFYQEAYDRLNEYDDVFGRISDWVLTEDCIKFIKPIYETINGELNSPRKYMADEEKPNKKPTFSWKYDWHIIAPAVSRVAGYDIRDPDKYTHWYTLLGYCGEVGPDCYFAQVMDIRNKRNEGKKLEKHERDFYNRNKKDILLPSDYALSADDLAWIEDGVI